jgi:hypothetical protein
MCSTKYIKCKEKKIYFRSFDAIFGKVARRALRGGCFATDKNEVFANVIVLLGSMSAELC